MMWQVLAQGCLLGLGAAVPIGPVNVLIMRRTLRGGFRQGFAVGCGAVTVDVIYAILTCFSLRPLLVRPAVQLPLAVGGILLLGWLSFSCFWAAAAAIQAGATASASEPEARLHTAYVTGLLMTLLNPMTLAFWFLVVPAAVGQAGDSALPLVSLGVFCGAMSWVLLFAGSLGYLRRFRQGWWMAAADVAGGLILAGFAVAAILALARR